MAAAALTRLGVLLLAALGTWVRLGEGAPLRALESATAGRRQLSSSTDSDLAAPDAYGASNVCFEGFFSPAPDASGWPGPEVWASVVPTAAAAADFSSATVSLHAGPLQCVTSTGHAAMSGSTYNDDVCTLTSDPVVAVLRGNIALESPDNGMDMLNRVKLEATGRAQLWIRSSGSGGAWQLAVDLSTVDYDGGATASVESEEYDVGTDALAFVILYMSGAGTGEGHGNDVDALDVSLALQYARSSDSEDIALQRPFFTAACDGSTTYSGEAVDTSDLQHNAALDVCHAPRESGLTLNGATENGDLGLYGDCSTECGIGYKTRTRTCSAKLLGVPVPLDIGECDGLDQDNAGAECQDMAISPLHACSLEHYTVTDPWEGCSASCGGGTQKRRLHCIRRDDGKQVAQDLCGREGSFEIRTCNTAPCGRGHWEVKCDWSQCTTPDYPCLGQQHRTVECVKPDGTAVPEAEVSAWGCDEAPKPATVRTCPTCGDGIGVAAVASYANAAGYSENALEALLGYLSHGREDVIVVESEAESDEEGAEDTSTERRRALKTATTAVLTPAPRPSPLRRALLEQPVDMDCVPDCHGYGTWDPTKQACDCDVGRGGTYCEVCMELCATAVYNTQRECCDAPYVDAASGECCDARAAHLTLDRYGSCCYAEGGTDACGFCGGLVPDGHEFSLYDSCCPTLYDAQGGCCLSGVVDECGVCDGDNSSCAYLGQLMLSLPANKKCKQVTKAGLFFQKGAAADSIPTKEPNADAQAFVADLDAWLVAATPLPRAADDPAKQGFGIGQLTSLGCGTSSELEDLSFMRATFTLARLHDVADPVTDPTSGNTGVTSVLGYSSGDIIGMMNLAAPDFKHTGPDGTTITIGFAPSSATGLPMISGSVWPIPVCGDGHCTAGEAAFGGEHECPADCAVIPRPCPAPAGGAAGGHGGAGIPGRSCSGRGRCAGDSGTCGCWAGYTGDACDRCAIGYKLVPDVIPLPEGGDPKDARFHCVRDIAEPDCGSGIGSANGQAGTQTGAPAPPSSTSDNSKVTLHKIVLPIALGALGLAVAAFAVYQCFAYRAARARADPDSAAKGGGKTGKGKGKAQFESGKGGQSADSTSRKKQQKKRSPNEPATADGMNPVSRPAPMC